MSFWYKIKEKSRLLILFGCIGILTPITANALKTETSYIQETQTIPYKTQYVNNASIRKGKREVAQKGEDGEKEVEYKITSRRGKTLKSEINKETITKAPVVEIIDIGTKEYYTCSDGTEYETLAEKNECEKKISWTKTKDASLQECYNDPEKFNCWYDEYPGTTIHWSYYTRRYVATSPNASIRTGAICRDGWRSSATGRGACSHHGGVLRWI